MFVIPGLWVAIRGSVPIPIDEASISLLFYKIPVMVWCIIPGFNEGRFCSIIEFFKLSG